MAQAGANVEQLEAEIAELAQAEADMCQQVQRENPDDADIQANGYYHPAVRAISDRLRKTIVEWHAALPDHHEEFRQRALAPAHIRDEADRQLAAAVDRLHEDGRIEKAHHTKLHAAMKRTIALADGHRAAMQKAREA